MEPIDSGGSQLSLDQLKQSYCNLLLEKLDNCAGDGPTNARVSSPIPRVLVWDDALIGPINYLTDLNKLREHGVEKMYNLRPGLIPLGSCNLLTFLLRPVYSLMKTVADNITRELKTNSPRRRFQILFVPRRTEACCQRLRELDVNIDDSALYTVMDVPLGFMPIDIDILSSELAASSVLRSLLLEKDESPLFHIARGLLAFEALYGTIPNLYAKGTHSKRICQILQQLRREVREAALGSEDESEPPARAQVQTLVVLDRTVDPLTPLLTQLTYDGLIDELIGVENNQVRLPVDKIPTRGGPQQQQQQQQQSGQQAEETRKVPLDAKNDELYATLRNANFSAVPSLLSRRTKELQSVENERHTAHTPAELANFVRNKLKQVTANKWALALHVSITEMLQPIIDSDLFMDTFHCEHELLHMTPAELDKPVPFIELLIYRCVELSRVLRLVLLQCQLAGGLKPKLLEHYRHEMLHSYGFEHTLTLLNLERAGLLYAQTADPRARQGNWPAIARTLNLVVEGVNEQQPTDVSYVFSGYAPLSVRLAAHLSRPGGTGWHAISEVLARLPGDTLELPADASSGSDAAAGDRTTLVFFVGGVTRAELAAFRFLSRRADEQHPANNYIVGCTRILNGSQLIDELSSPLAIPPSNPF